MLTVMRWNVEMAQGFCAARCALTRQKGTRPVLLAIAAFAGCSRAPARFDAPQVDPVAAAAQAMELYDANRDAILSKDELARCPGILSKISVYDLNHNGSVEQQEIAGRLADLLKHRTGGTGLNARILYNGRPLQGASVVLEPEPYLGGQVQTATGTTDGAGSTELAIPPEFVPQHLRRIKSVHYGTFKVRITHPTIPIPPKYNTETQLGYETESGNPYVRFTLTSK
jgi:hypothetical protein